MKIVNFDSINVDRNEVVKQLSRSRKNRKKPNDKLNNQISEMMEFANEIMEPKAVYELFDISELPEKPYFEFALEVGFALCTIGAELPNKVEEFLRNGKLVNGVILDAIGSVAADNVADYTNEIINKIAKEKNLVPSMRYSPGYCDAPLRDQVLIFDKLTKVETDKIGVSLSDSFMMSPIKSVSFAINLGLRFINRCKTCTKENCPHRR